MLSQISKSKKEKGFTIIEVLIVLAIAGLILLVVFLAVPALQRNSRNTQRTNDAGNILSSMSEYVGNNNGRLPATTAAGGTSGTGNTLTVGDTNSNQLSVNLGYYDAADIDIVDYTSGMTNTTTTDSATVVKQAHCSDSTIGDPVDGTTRSVVIIYTLEEDSKQCRES
jgi:prepilin-type N-terminal cleavage/methylation domain-containing protein